MTPLGAGVLGAISALAAAAATSGLVAWAGPVDRPRERGQHRMPTPTAGGLGVMAGGGVGLLVFTALAPLPLPGFAKIAAAFGFAAALGLIGALDDLYDLGARAKLAIQAALALLFALMAARIEAIPLTASLSLPLGPAIGVLGTALWLVVVVNAVNFMDGANGLAAGALVVVLIAFALAAALGHDPALAAAAGVASFGGLGFLPWNFPRARLFQGDAGALFSSFFVAALAVIGAEPAGRGSVGPVSLFFVPLALTPFLADVLLTLLARARSGKPLFSPHREHLYQRWLARNGGDHAALAWRTFAIVALFSGAALAVQGLGAAGRLAALVIGIAVAALAWVRISRAGRQA